MVQKEEIYYASADGIDRIHASVWMADRKPAAVLQIIHGMQEYIDRYDEFARFMAEKGIAVCGEDHLGHGKSVAENGTYGYFCKEHAVDVLAEDAHQLTLLMKERFKDLPFFIMGHSFGSFITREYITRYGREIAGVILSGTGYQSMALVETGKMMAIMQRLILGEKHPAKFLNQMAFGSYLSKIPDPKTQSDWLSHNEENVAAYCKDPWCNFLFTVNGFETMGRMLERVGSKKRMRAIPKELPILLASGREDPVGGYGRDVTRLYNVYKNELELKVECRIYDGMRHELHNEPGRKTVYDDYFNWVMQII